MPNPTLREIVETFTEEELNLTVPIEFQDVSLEDYPYVNEYNRLLASAQANLDDEEGYNAFQAAHTYRIENKDKLDKYIIDAHKLNILMTLILNAYAFSKGEKSAINTSYDNTETKMNSQNLQDAIGEIIEKINGVVEYFDQALDESNKTIQDQIDELKGLSKHVYVTKLPSNPDSNTYYYVPEA